MKTDKPTDEEVIATAKKLLANGQAIDAQNLLLDEGYVKYLNPAIQEAYLRLIPINPTLRKILDGVYRDLDDPSANIRFKALTQLAREFAKATLRDNIRWMRDPRASEPLIKAALDRDRKIYDRALIVLSRLVCQYFPDQRSLPAFLMRLADRKQETRNLAISGIGCLRHEEVLVHLVDLFDHGTDQDRAEVCRQIWGLSYETWYHMNQHPIEWTEFGRRFWRDKMITALRDSCLEARKNATRALKELGTCDTVFALEAARSIEQNDDIRFYLDDTIAAIKERTLSP